MSYDVSLGGIALPTFEQDFAETLGSDYTLVGSAVMPGPPRPASMYSFTINIYGDTEEPDRTTAGFTKRGQVKTLLQNAASRYAGLAFTCAFDSALNGYLVIGTADLSYNVGGATFGDFQLRVSNAVWIPAALTIQAMVTRPTVLSDAETSRHYLPVGAFDVRSNFDPLVSNTGEYATIEGKGVYVEGRGIGESLLYEQDWDDVLAGSVRIWDRRGSQPAETTKAGDLDPERAYGWVQAPGPMWVFTADDPPVIENGRCRVQWKGGYIFVETSKGQKYREHGAVATGYVPVGRPRILEWTSQEGVISVPVQNKKGRADVVVRLARGWEGPQIDVVHQGERVEVAVEGITHHAVEHGSSDRLLIGSDASVRAGATHRVSRAEG